MERFGEKLQILRQQHKMRQRQLSDLLGVHHSYVGALELGKKSLVWPCCSKYHGYSMYPLTNWQRMS